MCRKPYTGSGTAFGCGQCLPCRMNRRRVWTHRLMIENYKHCESSFVTLTYSPDNMEMGGLGVPTLRKKHLQDWLKRLRWVIGSRKIRYFVCGEYGDRSERPHYHAMLFGYKGCRYSDSRLAPLQPCVCESCELIRRTWGKGLVHQGVVDRVTMQYVSGYVVKKMTRKDDVRLKGREPEFARMSLRPGIGAEGVHDVARVLGEYRLAEDGDVPAALRHGARVLPLGRYLRRRLRRSVGKDEKAPVRSLASWLLEVQAMRSAVVGKEEVVSDEEVIRRYNERRQARHDEVARQLEARFNRGKRGVL